MKIQAYQCDECGVQKKESNHWVLCLAKRWIELWPWDEVMAVRPEYLHLCGEGCAGKVQSRVIASWKLQPREEAR